MMSKRKIANSSLWESGAFPRARTFARLYFIIDQSGRARTFTYHHDLTPTDLYITDDLDRDLTKTAVQVFYDDPNATYAMKDHPSTIWKSYDVYMTQSAKKIATVYPEPWCCARFGPL